MPASNSGYLYGDTNPAPTNVTPGSSVWGSTPGQLSVPTSQYGQLLEQIPGFGNLTGQASSDIGSLLGGQLSPGTMMNIGNYAASRGVALGQPNSPLSNLTALTATGNTSEGLMGQGLGAYENFTGTLGSEMINPALTNEISMQNAVDAAAPNPAIAGQYMIQLMHALEQQTPPGGGSGSGFSSAIGDISSVLGLIGQGGGKGAGGSSIGGGGGTGLGAILGML